MLEIVEGVPKQSSLAQNLSISKKSDQADIRATKSTHEMIIFTKFYKDWSKIVDFLLLAIFGACLLFFPHLLEILIIISHYAQLCKDNSRNVSHPKHLHLCQKLYVDVLLLHSTLFKNVGSLPNSVNPKDPISVKTL